MHFKWITNCQAISLLPRRNSPGQEAIGPLCPEHQNKIPNRKMKPPEAVGGEGYVAIVCCGGVGTVSNLDFWADLWETMVVFWAVGSNRPVQTTTQDRCPHGDMVGGTKCKKRVPFRQRVGSLWCVKNASDVQAPPAEALILW